MLLMISPPFSLFGLPLCWKWFRMFGEESVDYSRYFLIPGWNPAIKKNEESKEIQGQNFVVKII